MKKGYLAALVRRYNKEYKPQRVKEQIFFEQLPNLQAVVNMFGYDIYTKKRHGHARRLKYKNLLNFRHAVSTQIARIRNSNTWKEIHTIVKNCKVPGIGLLSIYDMTRALCAHLKLVPLKVDLHAGTKVGAQRLIGRKHLGSEIAKSDLPSELYCLNELDLEDFLCIFKNHFGDVSLPDKPSRCFPNKINPCETSSKLLKNGCTAS